MPPSNSSQTLIIGLSGPSSSGKTTLARLLRGIFNVETPANDGGFSLRLFIIHEDDFYKTDKDIPVLQFTSPSHGTRNLQDWDSVESLNLPLLDRTLRHVKAHGRPPADMSSIEDQNSVGEIGVDANEITELQKDVTTWAASLPGQPREVTICVMDGFLLFPPPASVLSPLTKDGGERDTETGISSDSVPLLNALRSTLDAVLDLKVFLPSNRARTVERRAGRSGYVTIEGFWTDPPGYVEDVVWPNYARDHGWMFASREDVDEGRVWRDGELVRNEGIVVGPGCGEVPMREVLRWGVDVVKDGVERLVHDGR